MKRLTKPTLAVSLSLILFGCSKNNSESSPSTDQTPELHTYGVLPMQPEQWSFVPEFSKEIVLENARTSGLPIKACSVPPWCCAWWARGCCQAPPARCCWQWCPARCGVCSRWSAKGVVDRLDDGLWALLRTPELYAWALVAIAGTAWQQSSFRAGALTASLPTMTVTEPVVGSVLGIVVLGETLRAGDAGWLTLIVAVAVMVVATAALARGEAVGATKQPV